MSLLGKFYEMINGSPELLASESLNYILNKSQKANENLVKLINHDNGSNYSEISFLSQVHGENNEIPDLSGYDKKGTEVIILETKFWASLTGNQPGTYIKRVADNGTLAFICPDLRIHSLKGEILNALNEANISYSIDNDKILIDKKAYLFIRGIISLMQWNGKINTASNGDRPYYPIRIKPGDIEETVINSISDFIKDIYRIYKKNI